MAKILDAFLVLGSAVTLSILISIITAFFVSYRCQKAILKSQVELELKLAQEKSYIDQPKRNLEDYLRKLTKIQRRDHITFKKLKKLDFIKQKWVYLNLTSWVSSHMLDAVLHFNGYHEWINLI